MCVFAHFPSAVNEVELRLLMKFLKCIFISNCGGSTVVKIRVIVGKDKGNYW
jgi:hypothetical protein